MKPKFSYTGGLRVGPERLLSKRGTIIPMVVRFIDGTQLLSYHTAEDAAFAPTGLERSVDDGFKWEPVDSPLHRIAAVAELDDNSAVYFDQYLLETAPGTYANLTARTTDSGATFEPVTPATFHVPQLLPRVYDPLPADAPNAWTRRQPPPAYDSVLTGGPIRLGGYLFGRALRLPDGALGLAVYGSTPDTPVRPAVAKAKDDQSDTYSVAELTRYNAVVFCRSDDEGLTWHGISVLAQPTPEHVFSLHDKYAEGFNETAITVTADNELLAICRHGSYSLLWYTLSADNGRTWSPMAPLNYPGVAPSMLTLGNGVIAAAWGRPGLTIGFSLDGLGRDWHLLSSVMPDTDASQKYPWLVPMGAKTLLLVYDRREWNPKKHTFTKHGIHARMIFLD